ncbi:MAG: hypothetical protein S4CHLAM7_00920 [Chlamydiae bacterium]|nr:hypothetical protein [Chlamydiota bacterium]
MVKSYSLVLIIFSIFLAIPLRAHENLQYSVILPHQNEFNLRWEKKNVFEEQREKIIDWVPSLEIEGEGLESFTLQAYQLENDFQIALLFDKFIQNLKEEIDPPELVHYEVHSKNKDAVYFEWWVNAPFKGAQHEWVKIMKNKWNQLVMLRYTSKKELASLNQSLWIETVAQSQFCRNDTKDENCPEYIEINFPE